MATISIVFKLLQLVLCILLIGLTIQINDEYKLDVIYMTLGVFLGYLWVVGLLILACLMEHELNKTIEALPLGCAFLLFIATSIVLLHRNAELRKSEHKSGFAGGIISILVACIFLVDCILTIFFDRTR